MTEEKQFNVVFYLWGGTIATFDHCSVWEHPAGMFNVKVEGQAQTHRVPTSAFYDMTTEPVS